ncbi:hypothetical protein EVAR_96663_1 [Eumeta japonica]|uniref:Uncharacterized protein n=1 Tax=Eumeta variegata TaxID=151549 RepID=A0A4C1WJT6_EUMVA|nr:hypothetical protein EVAR_96663_1 [Eumeta japonica]
MGKKLRVAQDALAASAARRGGGRAGGCAGAAGRWALHLAAPRYRHTETHFAAANLAPRVSRDPQTSFRGRETAELTASLFCACALRFRRRANFDSSRLNLQRKVV